MSNPDPAFWAGRRVLITGHTGFKGGWLAAWLKRLGALPFGVALAPTGARNLCEAAGIERKIESRRGDIRDVALLTAAVQEARPEIVLHLAAQSLVRPSYADPVGTFATNVMGTVNLLQAVRATASVRAVIVVTSDKCYENREDGRAYGEDDPLGGHDPYSASKACAEIVTSAWRRSFLGPGERPVALASVRAGNVIGGGDWSEDRLVPDFVRAMTSGAAFEIRNPTATRPWQHVLEPLSGYLTLAEKLCTEGGAVAEAWNFGPDPADCRPVSYLAERMTGLWSNGAGWTPQPGQHPHEAHFLMVDSTKARTRLGWRPRLGLDRALDWTVDWYRRAHAGENAWALMEEQIGRYEGL